MTDDSPNLLEPKTNRTPAEVGREVFRLVQQYGEIRITRGESEYDIKVFVDEE